MTNKVLDENGQEVYTTNPGQQDLKDANANPEDTGKDLGEMTKEELLEYHKEYRKNSERGVQKLNEKLKKVSDPETVEEKARAIAKEELDKVYIKRTLTSIHNQLGTDEQREAFAAEFEFLTEGRTIDSDNVDKYIKKALELTGGKKPNDFVGMNLGGSIKKESSSQAKTEQRKEFAKGFVEEMGL